MRKLSILLVLALLGSLVALPVPVKAEGNFSYWVKTYGEKFYGEEIGPGRANAVTIAPNGDIIAVGYSQIRHDAWVLRLDENGNIKWQKTYGGEHDDWATAVAITDNGDVIVAGYTESFGAGNRDFWVLRLDENGNVKWQKPTAGVTVMWLTRLPLQRTGTL